MPDISGENNPFYGKKHTEEAKKKFSETMFKKGKLSRGITFKKGHVNPNPRPIYDIWLEKYGVDEADRRKAVWSQKLSIKKKGKNNNMYGKPSPQGAGNGWSGWYKGWFFRSLRELSYMINVIEKENLMWVSTETKEFAIPYINYDGTNRNYFADFLVDGNRLVEIKPKRLHSTPQVLIKKKAAERFCLKKGWTYELIEPDILTKEEILILHNNEVVKFLPRYEEKLKEKYL